MKKLLPLILFLISTISYSQIHITNKDGTIVSNIKNKDSTKIFVIDYILKDTIEFSILNNEIIGGEDFNDKPTEGGPANAKVFCQAFNDGKKIQFGINKNFEDSKTFFVCNNAFSKEKCTNNKGKKVKITDPTEIPIPNIQYNKPSGFHRQSNDQVLIIDKNPSPKENIGNGFCVYIDSSNQFISTSILRINSNFKLFIANCELSNLKEVSIDIDGEDYTYPIDIKKIFEETKKNAVIESGVVATSKPDGNEDENITISNKYIKYLKEAIEQLSKISYVNLYDLKELELYKLNLKKSFESIGNQNEEVKNLLRKIYSIEPSYLSIFPESKIPDNDEVKIQVTLERKNGKKKNYPFGPYKTKGGTVTSISTNLFISSVCQKTTQFHRF